MSKIASTPWLEQRRADSQAEPATRGVPPSILVNEPLMEPNLVTMRVLVGMRLKAHACALLELQVIHYKATQWLIWWQVNEWNLWKTWRYKNTRLLQRMGATLSGAHRRGLERLYNEFHRAVAPRCHPDDHG